MRALALIGVVGLVLVASAAGRPSAHAATCKPGQKPAVVGGAFACLKAGQSCLVKWARDYARSGFTCTAGRLRVKVAAVVAGRSPADPGSSRENPVPLGKPGVLGNGWTLTVTGVNADAAATLAAVDPANRPPLEGMVYVLVAISAGYGGTGSSHLTPATTLRAVAASGFLHTSANSFCGKLPPPNLDVDNPLTFKGGTISGYGACFMVGTDEVSTLELDYQQPLSTTQVWFALR